MPETGRAVVCPECATVNSLDPELQAALGGEDEIPLAFRRMNRNLRAFAFLLVAAFIVFAIVAAAWWLVALGTAFIAGAVLVSYLRPRWFQTP